MDVRVQTVNDSVKNVFITGGTTGIGLELARIYLDRGYHVGVCGRDLSKLPESYRSKYSNLEAYTVNVSNRDEVVSAIDSFVEKTGKIDIVVANAGRSVGSKTKIPSFDVARDVIVVNVLGVMNTFEGALNHMFKQKSGHLVAMSSLAGFMGLPGAASYSASKAAVTKLCESYAIDLEAEGINVTNVCPGFIDTPLTRKNDHSMPFLMSVEKGARKIAQAIDKKRVLFVFPWQMKIAVTILDKMPRWLYRKLMGIKFLNYSKG